MVQRTPHKINSVWIPEELEDIASDESSSGGSMTLQDKTPVVNENTPLRENKDNGANFLKRYNTTYGDLLKGVDDLDDLDISDEENMDEYINMF